MRQLRGHVHTAVEARQHRALPVQRLRALPQDERTEQTADQTETQAGESVCVCVAVNKKKRNSVRAGEGGEGLQFQESYMFSISFQALCLWLTFRSSYAHLSCY